ncbi:MFS transporter [Nonomuraea ferruginea]|uniref:MFS transporter n=1 Tax=Nonomuraea ferruginea TaxID=46174 RepID=A0ABT4T8W3_9ACTN|nr:MFS transporter [Nonomuraea ferruginea]MDA0645724.1 MFS transporter [Nonomuraea ferruginea]
MLTRYMLGALASRTGDEMSGPALLVAGLAVTGSPVLASSLLAGLTVSAAAGGPLLGVMLDRTRRPGRVLGWCLVGYGAGLLVVLAGLGRLPDAALIGVAVLTGLLGPSLNGGWTAQLPSVVGAGRLPRANALDAMSYNVAALAGPALVGVIATATGGEAAVVAGVVLLVAAMPAARVLPAREERLGKPGAVREELAAGFRAIAGNRALRRATVTSMVSMAGLAMLIVAAPLLGLRLAGDAGYGALLLAVTAGAALAANAVIARVGVRWQSLRTGRQAGVARAGVRWRPLRAGRQAGAVDARARLRWRPLRAGRQGSAGVARAGMGWDTVMVVSTLLIGVGTLVAAVAGSFAVAVLAAVVVGVGEGPQLTALFAVRHREAPERVRGQVFTTGASLKITSFAAGSALAGPLVALSPGAALLAGAGVQLLAVAAYGLLSLPRSALEGPTPYGPDEAAGEEAQAG